MFDVGVVVGRFQVPALHAGHIGVLDKVAANHKKVIIVLGVTPTKSTRNDPLDFESRKQMITNKYPNFVVLYIKDCRDDGDWSKKLDEIISDVVSPTQSVVLYGSRDSFLKCYGGRFKTCELVADIIISGQEVRKDISRSVMDTFEFRAGAVWSMFNQYARTIPTVDIAIFDGARLSILLVRKPTETGWRLPGGFAEPNSESFEADAIREAHEECGQIELSNMTYVGSFKIDDWRYRSGVDKIKTTLFMCEYVFGTPDAGDDVCEAKFFKIDQLPNIMPEHVMLIDAAIEKFKKL